LVTLGPLKVMPTFLQVTRQADRPLQRQLAWRSSAMATCVVLVVVLMGQNLLRVWQIPLPALMIAGGMLRSLVTLRLSLALAFPAILPPFGIAIARMLRVLSTELGLSSASPIRRSPIYPDFRVLGSSFYRLMNSDLEPGGLCSPPPLGQGSFAGHDADVFAVASGGERFAPGDSLAVAEQGHAVHRVDDRAVVAQQDMANGLLVEGG
jgi:hypothetical protein